MHIQSTEYSRYDWSNVTLYIVHGGQVEASIGVLYGESTSESRVFTIAAVHMSLIKANIIITMCIRRVFGYQ